MSDFFPDNTDLTRALIHQHQLMLDTFSDIVDDLACGEREGIDSLLKTLELHAEEVTQLAERLKKDAL